MNLLTYTPPERRVRVIHHQAPGPVRKITHRQPVRLRKGLSAVRVQIDLPEGPSGINKSLAAYVVLDWENDFLDDAVHACASHLYDLWIEDINRSIDESLDQNH